MFSGIVSALGRVEVITGERLEISHPKGWGRLALGDSLAVNGCCLTVAGRERGAVGLEVMPETWRRTNLGRLEVGSQVNLEEALALGAPVGGHLVSGHVDATGEVAQVEHEGNARWLTVTAPDEVGRLAVAQGSIAIDGCSLTLVAVADLAGGGAQLRVSLVPHTVSATIAAGYRAGSVVNLEADPLARLVERLLAGLVPQAVRPGGAG